MAKLTSAQVRTMRVIRRSGSAPSNTTMALLRRLKEKGLIVSAGMKPIAKMGNWRLTPAGIAALEKAEGDEACRALVERTNRILGSL